MSVSNILKENQYSNVDIFCKTFFLKKMFLDTSVLHIAKGKKHKMLQLGTIMSLYIGTSGLVGNQGLVAISEPQTTSNADSSRLLQCRILPVFKCSSNLSC